MIGDRIPEHDSYEFLAFGVISGPAHKAVALKNLKVNGYIPYSGLFMDTDPSSMMTPYGAKAQKPRSSVATLKQAYSIGRLFDKQFALPVTAYLLAIRHDDIEDNEKVFRVPTTIDILDYSADRDVGSGKVLFTGPFLDAKRAMNLLRSVAKARQTFNDDMEDVIMEADPNSVELGRGDSLGVDEGEGGPTSAKKAILESTRVPKMV